MMVANVGSSKLPIFGGHDGTDIAPSKVLTSSDSLELAAPKSHGAVLNQLTFADR